MNRLKGVKRDRRLVECTYSGIVTNAMAITGNNASYDFVMAASGSAFKLLWLPPSGCFSNSAALCLGNEEVITNTFDLLSCHYRWMEKDATPEQESQFKAHLVNSIDLGLPVIIIGEEPFLCTGYKDNGNKVLGQGYFQWNVEEDNWYRKTQGIILIGAPKPGLSRKEIASRALKYAIELSTRERTQKDAGHHCGSAAYDAWVHELRNGAFSADNDGIMECQFIHSGITLGSLIDGRRQAVLFIESMADFLDEGAAPALAAADIYNEEVGVLNEVSRLIPSPSLGGLHMVLTREELASKLLTIHESSVRDGAAELLLKAKQLDANAIEQLKICLERL